MKTLARMLLLLTLLPLSNLLGQQGKPSAPATIDPALSADYYQDCMKRTVVPDPTKAEEVCKLESADPGLLKNYGKQDETGRLVLITDEDRAQYYSHCISSPLGDTTDPVLIAHCKEDASDNIAVHVFLSDPVRKVRAVYVANFRAAKKIKEALRDTCIHVAGSAEQSDATLMQVVNLAKYRPDQNYDTVCASDSVSLRCTDGVNTDTTNCGPDGNCVSSTRHTTFKTLALVDSHNGKELDWIEPVELSPKPSDIAESLTKAVGCAKGKSLTD